jgi:tetratricopeptide (TPR) repeat protein
MKSAAELPERLQLKLSQLNRAIFSRESGGAAKLYAELIEEEPELALRSVVQYDLARLLELGNNLELALKAFEVVIKLGDDGEYYGPALRQSSHICFRSKNYDQAYEYLTLFLDTNPARAERMDAEDLLSRIPPAARKPVRGPKNPSMRVSGDQVQITPTPASERPDSDSEFKPKPPADRETGAIQIAGLDQPTAPPPASRIVAKPNFPAPAQLKTPSRHSPPSGISPMPDFAAPPPPIRRNQPGAEDMTAAPHNISAGSVVDPPRQFEFSSPPSNQRVQKQGGLSPEFARADSPQEQQRKTEPSREKAAPAFESPAPPVPSTLRRKDEATGAESNHPPSKSADPFKGISPSKMLAKDDAKEGSAVVYSLAPPQDNEEPERRYLRLRGASFALLLPIGKRIHIDSVADLVAKRDELDEPRAKMQVIARKGIIYDQLTINDVIEMWPLVKSCRQSLVFVHVDRTLRPYEMFDALGAEALPPGLKITTEKGVKKARWIDVKLISAGTINKLPTIDIFSGVPLKHYRFQEGSFNFSTLIESARREPERALLEFVQLLCEQSPKAIRTHTLENLRTAGGGKPQSFASLAEFDCYNRWQLFSHHAEVVNAGELSEQYKSMSNW